MIKTFLKKISKLSLIISLLLFSQNIYAIGNKIVTFKPVDVTITNQLFIFKEAYGSVEDDFSDVLKEVHSFLVQNGANSSRKVLMYLDYGVTKTNPTMFKSNINVDASLVKYLKDTYGESTLKSYRRVLVGYLVPPQYFVATREPFKEYSFKNIRVKAIQSMDKDVKTPLSVLQENGQTIQDDAINNAIQDSYTNAHKLYDKIAMMNYLSLRNNDSDYIGLMEMFDTKLNVFTFMAIPGDQNQFAEEVKLSKTISQNKFEKRPDVEIEEESPSGDSPQPSSQASTAETNSPTNTATDASTTTE